MSEESTVRSGRIRRTAPLVGMGARTGLGRVGVLLRPGTRETRQRRTLEFHARTAERYAGLLGDMKGALMKVGQIMSFVESGEAGDPAERERRSVYQQALASLQSAAPPMERSAAAAVVEAELGAPPDEVFDSFSAVPIASASIGQVHAAVLDGRDVAVKVQYPGVATAIEADLENTELLASILRAGARALPGFSTNVDFGLVVEEIRDRVSEELDYETEAANQDEFSRIYEGHPFIRIPEVVHGASTSRVLTMEMIDGIRFDEACEHPRELRDRWGEAILRFVWGGIHRFRIFNADPHPGNYLFHDDGRVTFLDFGCVKRFSEEQEARFRAAATAAMRGDADALHAEVVAMGSLPDGAAVSPERLLEWYLPAVDPLVGPQPYTYTREWAASEVKRQYDPFNEFKDVSRQFTIPKDILFLGRITMGLHSALGMLEATCEARSIGAEYYEDAPPVTELGRADAAWRVERGERSCV